MHGSHNAVGVITELFIKLNTLFWLHLDVHSKTCVVRIDITYPLLYGLVISNDHIVNLINLVKQELQRRGFDPIYGWKREIRTSIHPHYHLIFFLNGHKVHSEYTIGKIVEKHWGNVIGWNPDGLIDYCNGNKWRYLPNAIMCYRGQEMPLDVIKQIRYVADDEDIGEIGDGIRNWNTSQLWIWEAKARRAREMRGEVVLW